MKKSAINAKCDENINEIQKITVAKILKSWGYWTLCAIRRQQFPLRWYHIWYWKQNKRKTKKKKHISFLHHLFVFFSTFTDHFISVAMVNVQRTTTHLHTSNPNGDCRLPIADTCSNDVNIHSIIQIENQNQWCMFVRCERCWPLLACSHFILTKYIRNMFEA